MKSGKFKILSWIVFVIAMGMLTLITVPLIHSYNDPVKFNAYIDSLGTWGIAMMFFIQVSQIIVAFIPGELVEFVAGTLYGWLGGLVFCLAGILVGQWIIFKTVKTFGKRFAEKVAGSKMMSKMSFLQDEAKLKSVVFILFFLPGTPKDLITYMVPFTKIGMRDFLIISLIARIPSVVSSTYAGGAFAHMNFIKLAIAYVVIAAFSLGGLIIYRKWEKRRAAKKSK